MYNNEWNEVNQNDYIIHILLLNPVYFAIIPLCVYVCIILRTFLIEIK